MRSFQHAVWVTLVLGSGVLSISAAGAAEPCNDFSWDVHQERALFGSTAAPAVAGKVRESAVPLFVDRLYQVQLSPQNEVTFVAGPGKKMLSDGAYAGLAAFDTSAPGTYRVSLDVPFWIDVVANGQLVASKDFQGARGCNAPHKIVAYELPAAKHLVLQFSGATSASVRVAITRVPEPKG